MSGKWLADEVARQIASCRSLHNPRYFVLALGGLFVAGPASADGILFVTSSRYVGTADTVTVGQTLPNSTGATAVADGSYPDVFANDTADGNFGITAPIELRAYELDFPHFRRAVYRAAQKVSSVTMNASASSSGRTVRPNGAALSQRSFHSDQ
jgi:hypothetical protein